MPFGSKKKDGDKASRLSDNTKQNRAGTGSLPGRATGELGFAGNGKVVHTRAQNAAQEQAEARSAERREKREKRKEYHAPSSQKTTYMAGRSAHSGELGSARTGELGGAAQSRRGLAPAYAANERRQPAAALQGPRATGGQTTASGAARVGHEALAAQQRAASAAALTGGTGALTTGSLGALGQSDATPAPRAEAKSEETPTAQNAPVQQGDAVQAADPAQAWDMGGSAPTEELTDWTAVPQQRADGVFGGAAKGAFAAPIRLDSLPGADTPTTGDLGFAGVVTGQLAYDRTRKEQRPAAANIAAKAPAGARKKEQEAQRMAPMDNRQVNREQAAAGAAAKPAPAVGVKASAKAEAVAADTGFDLPKDGMNGEGCEEALSGEVQKAAQEAKQTPAQDTATARAPRVEKISAAEIQTAQDEKVVAATQNTVGKREAAKPAATKKPAPNNTGIKAAASQKQGNALGNLFYGFGFYAEVILVRIGRILRDAGLFIGQMLGWMFGGLFKFVRKIVHSLWHDMTAPFKRMKNGMANIRAVIKEEKEKAKGSPTKKALGYFGSGVKTYGHLALNMLGLLLPVAATAALVVTVYSVMSASYGIAVEVDGEVLGYVADQSVVDDAASMLRMRLRLAGDQKPEDWQLQPTYTVARTASFSTKQELVNEILLSRSTDVVQATGLTINGQLVAVTTEGERLQTYLNQRLAAYADPAHPDATVTFVKDVVCETNTEDVYFASSVMEYEDIIRMLSQVQTPTTYATADGERTLNEIAMLAGLPLRTLILRNPAFEGQEGDFVPEAGSQILLRRETPYLQVQLVDRVASTETLEHPVEETENPNLPKGQRVVSQQGVDGEQQVYTDYYYVDGELDHTDVVEEMTVVLTEPVPEIAEVGTGALGGYQGVGIDIDPSTIPVGAGGYMWPVPGYSYSSRGVSQGHRGQDINAATGTPIFASQTGVVTFAGWHYSYGYYVEIAHADGFTTLYAHCSSLAVVAGQSVGQGEYIGAVGSTGNSSGPHCHFEMHGPDGSLLNPLNYVVPPHGLSM